MDLNLSFTVKKDTGNMRKVLFSVLRSLSCLFVAILLPVILFQPSAFLPRMDYSLAFMFMIDIPIPNLRAEVRLNNKTRTASTFPIKDLAFLLSWLIAILVVGCNPVTPPTQTVTPAPTRVSTVIATFLPSITPGLPSTGVIVYVVFREGSSEIYRMNADGTGVTKLTDNQFYDNYPTRSPDGKRIVFQSNRDGNDEIYVVNADGSGLTNLTNHPAGKYPAGLVPRRDKDPLLIRSGR
jgi:hypothetical protein